MTGLAKPHQALVLHAGAVGDFALTWHVCGALRGRYPDLRITVCARCALAAYGVGRGPIDADLHPERLGLHHLYGTSAVPDSVVRALAAFDLVVAFLGGPDSNVAKRLSEVTDGRVVSLDPAPRADGQPRHITSQWFADLADGGLALEPVTDSVLEVTPAERDRARIRLNQLAGGNPGRLVICHPGSGGRAKCCPLPALEGVLRLLRRQGDRVLWMIGPTELDWHGTGFAERLTEVAPVIFEGSLPDAAGLLAGADAFVGNDAGMTHLAALLGLPTVALFGPTDPVIWRPLGPIVHVLSFDSFDSRDNLPGRVVAALQAR